MEMNWKVEPIEDGHAVVWRDTAVRWEFTKQQVTPTTYRLQTHFVDWRGNRNWVVAGGIWQDLGGANRETKLLAESHLVSFNSQDKRGDA